MKSKKLNSVWVVVGKGKDGTEWFQSVEYTRSDARAVAKARVKDYKFPVTLTVRKFVDEKTTA